MKRVYVCTKYNQKDNNSITENNLHNISELEFILPYLKKSK